ncbi:hypothetical protein [Methylocystis sp.]|uniref:hypothetical protein n=1 Tax=Methylocystis sp. TaxID=1911079 RepID=UPI003D0F6099
MTDEPPPPNETREPARKGFWSLQSDEESVARGQNNFWAMLETVLAIVGFWYVALTYETFLLLYTSLFIAPLLFLRSEESVRQGVRWFNNGIFPSKLPEDPGARADARKVLERRWAWIGAGIGIIVALAAGYTAAKLFLAGHDGWAAFWRGAVFLLAMTNLAGAVAIAVLVAGEGERAVGGTGMGARAVAVAAAAAAAGAVAGAAAAAGAGAAAAARAESALIIVGAGFFTGFWLMTLLIRFAATARFLFAGYRQAPANIERLALRMAPLQMPELLPGLPPDHDMQLPRLASSFFSDVTTGADTDKAFAAVGLIFLPLMFFPGWAYRVILKSTLWFWWILFIVGGAPKIEYGIEGLRADAYRKALSWVFLALAIYGVAGFIVGAEMKAIIENHRGDAPLISSAALLFLVDWSKVPAFQWVALAASALTLGVALWTHALVIDRDEVPGRAEKVAKALPRLGYLVKWKSGVGMASIALTMLCFALYANAQHGLAPVSTWAADWLRWLYGDTAQALLGQS